MEETVSLCGLTKTFRPRAKQRMPGVFRRSARGEPRKRLVAVDNLSLSVRRGEIFGLLGPNGAGKTTALRMLAALIRPERGDAFIDGDSILTRPAEVRRKTGFLAADMKLEEFFTPSYLFDFFAALRGVPSSIAGERKASLFKLFGVDEFAHARVKKLSTGMKQKLSLLIPLVHDPAIIIFDDPANGLDIIAARTVAELLLKMKEQGKTIILSTHIFSFAEKVCDRIAFLVSGKLEACDTPKGLSAGGSLEDAFFDAYRRAAGRTLNE
jgi:sodium transport system ATP-binding protein